MGSVNTDDNIMATALGYLVDTFWSPDFWIEGNVTWTDLEAKRQSGVFIALPRDLLVSFPLALLLFILRLLWERLVAVPLGRYRGVSEKQPRKAVPNTVLEEAYKKHGKHPPDHQVLTGIAKQADWSPRHVQRWWRRRRLQDKPPDMQKFMETSWRFLFYLVSFWYGIAILWNKDYFWDTRHVWDGYPYQETSRDIYWYYMVELGFYWSLILSLFKDHKRKDFVEHIVHHIATIGLMSFSWSNGTCRTGALVLVLHDAVDYWMEGAKLWNYLRVQWLCDTFFVIFAIVWFITRIVLFPWKIIYNSYYESWEAIGHTNNSWVVFYGLLFTLQVLHIIWFYMIMRMVYRYVIVGVIEKDDRSETEPEYNSEDDKVLTKDVVDTDVKAKDSDTNGVKLLNNNMDNTS